jgi:hypothetical protein
MIFTKARAGARWVLGGLHESICRVVVIRAPWNPPAAQDQEGLAQREGDDGAGGQFSTRAADETSSSSAGCARETR